MERKFSNADKFVIGKHIEEVVKNHLGLQDSGSKFFDALKLFSEDFEGGEFKGEAYEIKGCFITHRNTPRVHALGRFFFSAKEHRRFRKLAKEKNLKPFYLLACYFFNRKKPKIITLRQASWYFVNSFVKGRKHFRIPLSVLGMLREIKLD